MRGRIYVIFAIFSVIILQGCNTKTIRIDQIPQLQTGSPLSGIEPLTFKINEFEDVRPNKKIVGACRIGPKIELDEQKVSEIITQAIANELKRNGHKVLQTGESDKADVIIDGIVRGYWIQHDNYAFSMKITGMVETEINVTTRQGTDKPLSKTYRGDYYFETGKPFLSPVPIWKDIINQALLEMLKEFTTDEEFLNKIKQVRKQGS